MGESCDAPACWTDFGDWSQCSLSCGGTGTQTRSKSCIQPENGGQACPDQNTWGKVKTAMCQLAGLTLVIGHNAPCHAEAPAPRPEPSLVSSPKMAESPAPSKTPSRGPSLAMPQPAGQNTLIGLHARDSADKLEISQGAGAAFNQKLVACHAPMRQQRRRHRTVIPSDYLRTKSEMLLHHENLLY